MKKRDLICLVLIAATIAVFLGYQSVARLSEDHNAPQISVGQELLELSIQESRAALLQGVTAHDKRDGDVTASLVVENVRLTDSDGTADVTYAAFDKAGNVAKLNRQIRYIDYESPRFILDAPLMTPQGVAYDVLSYIEAEDQLDGNITHRIRATALSEQNVTSLGEHDIKFRVTNSMGDTAELILPLEVYMAGSYEAKVTLTDYLVYLPQGSAFNAQSYLESYVFGGTTVPLKNGIPDNYSLRTTGAVDTKTPGVYPVSYKVSYTREGVNPVSYSGYSRLIVVVEG